MDPLSLTASIIAVLGVGGQAVKGIAKLSSMRGTPELILALNNEISDLHVVILAIQDVVRQRTTSGPGQRAGDINIDASITNSLRQANDLVTDLEAFYDRLKVSSPGLTSTITFNRTVRLREQRRIKKMKEDLKSVRIKLTTALGALNVSALLRLETHLRTELQEQKRLGQEAEASQGHRSLRNETSIQNLHQKIDDLQMLQHQYQAKQEQQILQQATSVHEPINCLLKSQNRLELKLDAIDAERIARTVASDPQPSRQSLRGPAYAARSMETIQISMALPYVQCTTGCCCICHRRNPPRTPKILDRLFGILLVGYSGVARVTPTCDSIHCVQRSVPNILISYFFPWWLLARALIILARLSLISGPEMVIRVPRIVNENSRIFNMCTENDTHGLRELVQQGLASPFDVSALRGETALQMAIVHSSIDICQALIQMGADPYQTNHLNVNSYGTVWLRILSNDGDSSTLNALRALFPSDDYIESQDLSLVHRIVLNLTVLDLNTILANSPRSVIDKCDASGRTPLWWATYRADYTAVSTLLTYGADMNKKSISGWDPLRVATYTTNRAIIKLLLGHGCDISHDPIGCLPIHSYAHYGSDLDVLQAILARGIDVNTPTSYSGLTALIIAAEYQNHVLCGFLIAQGANLDKVNFDGESAIHVAIQYNSHKALSLLLQHRANYLLRTRAGETLLHYAAQFGNLECLRILHAHDLGALSVEDRVAGQSVTQRFKDMKNLTALQIADLRKDITAEWHAMFRKLVNGIECPESKSPRTTNDTNLEEFHDALEHLDLEA